MDNGSGAETGPRALLVSPQDLRLQLEQTILWRTGVERRHVADFTAAFEEAKRFHPNLVVVEGTAEQPVRNFLTTLRDCETTKGTAIVVLSGGLSPDAERALIVAGANLIVPLPLNVELWGGRLEQLLMAPPRFQARTPVCAALWTHEITDDATEFQGMSLNISSGGLRIEAGRFLLAGAKLPGVEEPEADRAVWHDVGVPPLDGVADSHHQLRRRKTDGAHLDFVPHRHFRGHLGRVL